MLYPEDQSGIQNPGGKLIAGTMFFVFLSNLQTWAVERWRHLRVTLRYASRQDNAQPTGIL
jgi:hypothetical protein